ncbi:Fic family protein [bacterium]|nr:Fic family protein [bacterium]
MNRITGTYFNSTITGETVEAFVPHPLPPNPPIVLDNALRESHDRALLALGRLDSVTSLLPDAHIFLYSYVRKEAIVSSQIEGTQSSLSELFQYEVDGFPGVIKTDVVEVSRYVAALEHGLKRLKEDFPLSLRLIKEMHEILLSHGRGSERMPGEFRRSQNWIGGTRPGNAAFVPPPPDKVIECLSEWEKFLYNESSNLPILVRIGLIHAQFESIHPFLDGNGRIGRLLIPIMLCWKKILKEPLLYISLFFKAHQQEYYNRLQQIRINGDWEGWLSFFIEGIYITADQAIDTARKLQEMVKHDEMKIRNLGRSSLTALRVFHQFSQNPIARRSYLVQKTGLSKPTVNSRIEDLINLGIIGEIKLQSKVRYLQYTQYIKTLNEGTEVVK